MTSNVLLKASATNSSLQSNFDPSDDCFTLEADYPETLAQRPLCASSGPLPNISDVPLVIVPAVPRSTWDPADDRCLARTIPEQARRLGCSIADVRSRLSDMGLPTG